VNENAHKRQILKFTIFKYLSQSALMLSLLSLISVLIFILIRGLPHVNMQLLFGDYISIENPSIKPAIISTLYLIFISLLIAAPIGIGSAIFLTEYTNSKSRLIRYIRIATETLAGIPSIVYGLFGYLIFVITLGFNYSIIGGGITLAIMIFTP